MKKWMLGLGLAVVFCLVSGSLLTVYAQDAKEPAAAPAAGGESTAGSIQKADDAAGQKSSPMSFMTVVFSSGPLGVILWLGLFGAGAGGIYFITDCMITIKKKRIMPQALIDKVTAAMAEGDVMKALQCCEEEPGPMANVLTAGFSHVEEGFDIIQEAIGTAADLEVERMSQKLTWITVMANLAPMLGLLGTVQGMIAAFANLGKTVDVQLLAVNIAQALYTTAGGLCTAIPCVGFYYGLRNNANKIILMMQAMTMELIKDLRNVEVVQE